MKIFKGIASIVIVLVIGLVAVLTYYGLFAGVVIAEKPVGPYLLVYKKHIGPYENTVEVMDSLYADVKDTFGINTTSKFGLYYDNPNNTDNEKLRSIVGVTVYDKTMADLKAVREKYSVISYESANSTVARFPYKGKLSILVGIIKVYPKFEEYIQMNGYPQTPIMELYDPLNEVIEYISSRDIPAETFMSYIR